MKTCNIDEDLWKEMKQQGLIARRTIANGNINVFSLTNRGQRRMKTMLKEPVSELEKITTDAENLMNEARKHVGSSKAQQHIQQTLKVLDYDYILDKWNNRMDNYAKNSYTFIPSYEEVEQMSISEATYELQKANHIINEFEKKDDDWKQKD